ncbi:uncharacterized protein [Choristoneura fumiferana]|uniref:uncharacterized protein n=1 Tax=Choristoneura fumiferana TaxID=7141 RepID=UPI003D15E303
MLGWRFKMRVWWCVALCVCARAARPGPGPGPGPAGGGLTPAQPRDGDLTPEVIQQAIEMEMEDASEQDPMLVALRGAGRTRAALCGRGRGCAGALWGRRWLLTRASCAAALQPRHAAVLPHRGVASCRPDAPESGGIPVLARFVHPQYSGAESAAGGAHDAALLLLAAPAPVPPHTNHSRALLLVPE